MMMNKIIIVNQQQVSQSRMELSWDVVKCKRKISMIGDIIRTRGKYKAAIHAFLEKPFSSGFMEGGR